MLSKFLKHNITLPCHALPVFVLSWLIARTGTSGVTGGSQNQMVSSKLSCTRKCSLIFQKHNFTVPCHAFPLFILSWLIARTGTSGVTFCPQKLFYS